MSLLCRLLLIPLLIILPCSGQAAEPVKSQGFRAFTSEISCEAAVKSLDKKEGLSDFALLVSAFITGTNYVKRRDSKADLKSMMMLTEKYCRDNPNQPVTTALIVLDKAIDQRITQEKKTGTAKPAALPAVKPK
ncbi:MAG: hypothetical protein NDI73_04790 [Desulfuromonadales bacterium]|nr:hypothetical protein [Desulfuromonadales bacterium]